MNVLKIEKKITKIEEKLRSLTSDLILSRSFLLSEYNELVEKRVTIGDAIFQFRKMISEFRNKRENTNKD
jgi:hypothetical protein